jgi:hypothetical protein
MMTSANAAGARAGWMRMALAIDRGKDHIRVLSELSDHVVRTLLGDGDNGSAGDPFSIALRRYQESGAPREIDARWRRVFGPQAIAPDSVAKVLRFLARDLLEVVSSPGDDTARGPADEPAPSNVRPITSVPASVPALEQASDGSWRPSSGAVVASADAEAAQRRQSAFVASLTSRYPVHRSPGPAVDLPLPPDLEVPATAPERAAQRPIARETPPAAVVPPAPLATSGEAQSLIQQVAGGTEVIAGPFARFQDLAAFAKAVREIPGVHNVTTRQFVRGTVHLRVRHSPAIDLTDSLLALTEFSPQVVSHAPGKIEIAVGLAGLPPSEA